VRSWIGVGASRGDEVRRQAQELPQGGVAGADEHSEQVTGNGRVAEHLIQASGGVNARICSGS